MGLKIVWTEPSLDQLREACAYVSRDNPVAAQDQKKWPRRSRRGHSSFAPHSRGARVLWEFAILGVQGPEVLAGAVIGALEAFGAEGGPSAGTKDPVRVDVVHVNRDAEHGGQGDEIGADVAVAD